MITVGERSLHIELTVGASRLQAEKQDESSSNAAA